MMSGPPFSGPLILYPFDAYLQNGIDDMFGTFFGVANGALSLVTAAEEGWELQERIKEDAAIFGLITVINASYGENWLESEDFNAIDNWAKKIKAYVTNSKNYSYFISCAYLIITIHSIQISQESSPSPFVIDLLAWTDGKIDYDTAVDKYAKKLEVTGNLPYGVREVIIAGDYKDSSSFKNRFTYTTSMEYITKHLKQVRNILGKETGESK